MKYFTSRAWAFALVAATLALGLPLAAAQAQDDTMPEEPAGTIHIESPGLFPEGIEYDAVGERFLVGSLTQGAIFEVRQDGEPTMIIDDPDVSSSVGIQIDTVRNRLLVVSSDTRLFMDPTLPDHAELAAYDLETGARLFFADLAGLTPGGPNVANDVAVDADGNAYVTDTFAPVIYRVDPDGQASIFWEDARFDGQGGPGLNGIDYHPDGFLLVPLMGGGLYKVPVDDPAAMTEVELDRPILGADGVILHPDGRLIIVSGQLNTVFALRSDDAWRSATIEGEFTTAPDNAATTATVRDGVVYVLYAHLGAMMAGTSAEVFEIVPVDFDTP